MFKKRIANFDRELKGPDSYESFNDISKYCQNHYNTLIRNQLILLGAIAVISILPPSNDYFDKIFQSLNIIIMFIVLTLMIIQYSQNYMAGWQRARFLSESILSNCWLLIFQCDSYSDGDFESAIAKFHDRIQKMKNEINISDYLSLRKHINIDNDNPSWMQENYNKPIEEKKDFYIQYRMDNQIKWYEQKTKINNNKSFNYFYYGLASIILGIILTILVLIDQIPNLAYLGFFTTVTASFFSWKQTKRFDELRITYSVASLELEDFKNVLLRKTNPDEIKNIVFETEKSISREHKLWFNGMDIS